ncbi:MAG: LEA type 2 family protein [Chloracidobacterium sp.]|uniref:LEA type 2 family protein n=1 Tax=Chloracidobacterium validum TaxID=2821543 RepID=A0ABX8BD33_9BACT|nr:LEA type 2 family protein [Chloracidobacterium validum]QUW03569.1 LEA type 2 family protein [Chloracidobacterium validum]
MRDDRYHRRHFLHSSASALFGLAVTGNVFALPPDDEGKLPKGFREPTLTLNKLQVEQVDYPTAHLRADITIDNPNRSLTLTKLTYRIVLNEVECGTGQHPEKFTLPKKAPFDLCLPVTADLSAVPQLGLNTILQARLGEGVAINYVIHVAFDVGVLWLFKRHIKATLTGRLPLQDVVGKVSLGRRRGT